MERRLDELLGMEELAVYRNGYRPDARVWDLTPEALAAIDRHDAANAAWISSDAILWERYGKPYVSYLQFIDLGNRVGCIEHHEGIGRMFDYSTDCMREVSTYDMTSDKHTDLQLQQLAKIFSRPTLGGRFMLFPQLAKIAESELNVRAAQAVQKGDIAAYDKAQKALTPERPQRNGTRMYAASAVLYALQALHTPSRFEP